MALIVSQLMSLQDQSNVSTSPASSPGQADAAHQPVVGVHRHPETEAAQQPDGVLGEGGDGPRVHVGGGAHLEGHAPVPHVGGQPSERGLSVRADDDVVDDAHSVAEALGVAPLDGLPDRGEPECLAGVHGGVEVLPLHEVEGIEVGRGRVAGLWAGDVEAGHTVVAVAHGELGDLERPRRLAHGRQQGPDDDRAPGCGGAFHAAVEAGQHGLDDLFEGQVPFRVQLGGKTYLRVDDAVVGQVLHALGGHPLEGLGRLHDRHRVHEALQVAHEVAPRRGGDEPGRQLARVRRRQSGVALLGRQFDHRRRAEAPV